MSALNNFFIKKVWLSCLMLATTLSVLAAPGAHGPDGEHLANEPTTAIHQLGRQTDGSVLMPMAMQRQLNILTQFVQVSMTAEYVQLDGIVRAHPSGQAVVQSSSNGRLDAGDKGIPLTGQVVKAGDVLGYIRYQDTAFELASQTSELIAVRTEAEQVVRDIQRLQQLGDLAVAQQLEQLKTTLQRLNLQEQALQQGLEQPEVLLAPLSGIVHAENISRGQWVEAGETLFEIVDPTKLMIEASTADPHLLTAIVSATVEHDPQIMLQLIGHAARLKRGQIPLYFEPLAPAELNTTALLIEQPLRLHAKLKQQHQGIVLPTQAVVRNSANLPVVWIKLSAERFLPQQVQYQVLAPDQVLITDGLGEDNRVVVQGASLLNQIR